MSTPETPAPPPSAQRSQKLTYIAPGSKVIGTVAGSTEVLIEGEVEGEIQLTGRVMIGPQGRVKGSIHARSVRVAGKVVGNVSGLERVELLPSASLEGDVAAKRVVIAEGALFNGSVEMAAGEGKSVGRPEGSGTGQWGGTET